MDLDADPNLPPADDGGATVSFHSHLNTSFSSRRSHLIDSLRNNSPSQRSLFTNNIMLHISPAAGSAIFGYIYLAEAKLRHQDTITAYFNSVGWEVTVLPCPDFDSFLANTSLMYCNVLFITNLPWYIIPASIWILEANGYIASTHLDWLPNPPNLSSFQPSSRSTVTSRPSPLQDSCSLLSRQNSFVGRCPDPDGIDPNPSYHSTPRARTEHPHGGESGWSRQQLWWDVPTDFLG